MGSLLTSFLFLSLLLSVSSSEPHLCSQHDAAALIRFKSSFSLYGVLSDFLACELAGSKYYPRTISWKEGTDCCSWDGVTCDPLNGHVVSLDLTCSWLRGNIPSNSSLFLLRHLRKLNLAFNDFGDSEMPSEFDQFASLVYLNLSSASLGGHVPSQVSHLSKLVSLDLSGNYAQTLDKHTLEGLAHNLTEVRHLFLDRINMSSINPNLFMNLSSSLRSLSLNECDLRGNIWENIFHLPKLKLLNLGRNRNLNLDVMKFNRSNNLEHLDLSQMILSRELIGSIDNLQALKYLHLSDSNLSGPIPTSLGSLLQLIDLDLSMNHLSGKIPSSLTNLTHLEYLEMSSNSLQGSIPDELTAFRNLISLSLSDNLLNGTLPSWLYTVSSLKEIQLSDNQLSGHIKEFQSKSLQGIVLNNNNLQGPFPSSIFQLANLTYLYLSLNNLSGVVHIDMFSKLQNLQELDLSYNSLSLTSTATATAEHTLPNLRLLKLTSCNVSEFPIFLRGPKSLKQLDPSSNNSDSKVPKWMEVVAKFDQFLEGPRRFRQLDLSNNKIGGEIPKWMHEVGMDSLSYLNLSHNSLTRVGQLPWKNIEYLDLSSNLIHGNLPTPPWTTRVFLISNNSLTGEIPSLICNASYLEVLDLSHNNLSGIIPPCFGKLSQSLSFLNLQKNMLNGVIPPTSTDACLLSNLNLNGNRLQGPLSHSILSCSGLQVLDLGNNNINGTFPHWLASLPQLQVLILKSNRMHGSIHGIGSNISFSKIQIFDISRNYFTGPLPVRYIQNFTAMINLRTNTSAVPYMGIQTGGDFYSYSIAIVMKGQDMELKKIFSMWTIVDLSDNKFEGEIPKAIGELSSLKGLNLSHNNLSGNIPSSIGNLTNLEWLDLSSNKLVGQIPRQVLDLTYLSVLNLSENELVGCIPRGKQLNTFEITSYEGNKGLRGFPLSTDCNNDEPPPTFPPSNLSEEDGTKSDLAFGWKVVLLGYGCGIVLGLSMGYVVFQTGKPKWIVNLVEDYLHKRQSRKPRIAYRNNGRRMELVQTT
ncbi:hypothetical protein GQ457_07G012780 [Hibiscus cannabinus]